MRKMIEACLLMPAAALATVACAPVVSPSPPEPADVQLASLSEEAAQAAPAPTGDAEARCLALAMYHEARGEGAAGMRAVANVVLNRAREPRFPKWICAVVKQVNRRGVCQFSFWYDGYGDDPKEADAWKRARTMARSYVEDRPRDNTRGALFYHTLDIRPNWSRDMTRTATIGDHVFFR